MGHRMRNLAQPRLGLVTGFLSFVLVGLSYGQEIQSGWVVSFNNEEAKSQDSDETAHDHINTYSHIQSWLERSHLDHAYKRTLSFSVSLPNDKSIVFSPESLQTRVGTVMVRPNGEYKVPKGVYTDVDVQTQIAKYFGLGVR